jgi:hypothetical protein
VLTVGVIFPDLFYQANSPAVTQFGIRVVDGAVIGGVLQKFVVVGQQDLAVPVRVIRLLGVWGGGGQNVLDLFDAEHALRLERSNEAVRNVDVAKEIHSQ